MFVPSSTAPPEYYDVMRIQSTPIPPDMLGVSQGNEAVGKDVSDDEGKDYISKPRFTRTGIVSAVARDYKQQLSLFMCEMILDGRSVSMYKVSGKSKKLHRKGLLLAADAYDEPPTVASGVSIVLQVSEDTGDSIQKVETFSVSEGDQLTWLRVLNSVLYIDQAWTHPLQRADVHLRRVVGVGAFGEVYAATHASREVAVKVLRGNSADSVVQMDFAHEAGILCRLQNPNVLELVGVTSLHPDDLADVEPMDVPPSDAASLNAAVAMATMEDAGGVAEPSTLYGIVVEFCGGGTLDRLIARHGASNTPLDPNTFYRIALGIARGCEYIHALGIIHRDIKPENIMLTREHNPKLVDFGQSRTVELNRTMTANTCGSLLWRAPEIMSGAGGMPITKSSKYGTSADIYSVAVVLWQMLSLEEPYSSVRRSWSIVGGVQDGSLRPRCKDEWNPQLVALVQCSWAPDPASRPPATEMHAELVRCYHAVVGAAGEVPFPSQLAASEEEAPAPDAGAGAGAATGLANIELRAKTIPRDQLLHDISALAVLLRRPPDRGGLEVLDNRWFVFKVQQSFRGRDLVAWVQRTCACSADEAFKVGCALQEKGFITHSLQTLKFSTTCYFFWRRPQIVNRLLLLEDAKFRDGAASPTKGPLNAGSTSASPHHRAGSR